MTGTTTRTHGDRGFNESLEMPAFPTLAQVFKEAGYQAFAAGKLHVYPQRDRIGFDDAILNEEGRLQFGTTDDYEIFLGENGYAGQQFAHGLSNNDYQCRPWHLPEHCHPTTWTTRQMARMIQRRDPRKPGFWYLGYTHPHLPLTPPQCYLDLYRDIDPGLPKVGSWAEDGDALPYALRQRELEWEQYSEQEVRMARRAFYALCTHIDHQIRVVIGTLREERLLDNTIILFTSDHGEMLGKHRRFAMRLFYEESAHIPMILVGTAGDERIGHHRVDGRLVGLRDVMPTLLDLAGIPIPDSVEGLSMAGERKRDFFYGEYGEDDTATRMIHDGRYKLIYYPVGNHLQLFDLEKDPDESTDLAQSPENSQILKKLTTLLINEFYGADKEWVRDGKLMGLPDKPYEPQPNRGLCGQRGLQWPTPPQGGESNTPLQHN